MTDDTICYIKSFQDNEDGHGLMITNFLELHKQFMQIGSEIDNVPSTHKIYKRHEAYDDKSEVIASYSGPKKEFAIIGPKKARNNSKSIFSAPSKKHCTSFFWINNEVLLEKNILFEPWQAWEDLKLFNEADEKELNVVKMNFFEFTKIHSRDNSAVLYEWSDKDFGMIDDTGSTIPHSNIEKVLLGFLKSLRIKEFDFSNWNWNGSGDALTSLRFKTKFLTRGKIVRFSKEFEILQEWFDHNSDFITIVPLTDKLYRTYRNLEEAISGLKIPNHMQLKFFSTHRPRIIGDYWILVCTSTIRDLKKRAQPTPQIAELDMTDIDVKKLLLKIFSATQTTQQQLAQQAQQNQKFEKQIHQLEKQSERQNQQLALQNQQLAKLNNEMRPSSSLNDQGATSTSTRKEFRVIEPVGQDQDTNSQDEDEQNGNELQRLYVTTPISLATPSQVDSQSEGEDGQFCFSEKELTPKLIHRMKSLTISQSKIISVSKWIMKQREHHSKIVDIWCTELYKASFRRKILLLWLANEVAQNEKKNGLTEFITSFGSSLKKVLAHLSEQKFDEEFSQRITRLLKTWKDRNTFPKIQAELENIWISRHKKDDPGTPLSSPPSPKKPRRGNSHFI